MLTEKVEDVERFFKANGGKMQIISSIYKLANHAGHLHRGGDGNAPKPYHSVLVITIFLCTDMLFDDPKCMSTQMATPKKFR